MNQAPPTQQIVIPNNIQLQPKTVANSDEFWFLSNPFTKLLQSQGKNYLMPNTEIIKENLLLREAFAAYVAWDTGIKDAIDKESPKFLPNSSVDRTMNNATSKL